MFYKSCEIINSMEIQRSLVDNICLFVLFHVFSKGLHHKTFKTSKQ